MSSISNILADHNPKNINVVGNFINKNVLADFSISTNYNIANVSGQYIKCINFSISASTVTYTLSLPPITPDMVGYSFYLFAGDNSFNSVAVPGTGLQIVPSGSDLINGNNSTGGLFIYGTASNVFGWSSTLFLIQIYCDGTQWICSVNNA